MSAAQAKLNFAAPGRSGVVRKVFPGDMAEGTWRAFSVGSVNVFEMIVRCVGRLQNKL